MVEWLRGHAPAVITLAFPLAATVMWVAARDVFADDQADAGQDDRPAPPTLEA